MNSSDIATTSLDTSLSLQHIFEHFPVLFLSYEEHANTFFTNAALK